MPLLQTLSTICLPLTGSFQGVAAKGTQSFRRGVQPFVAWCVFALVSGCSSTRVSTPAPVEDRQPAAVQAAATVQTPKPLPGAENAGKPGYYTVRPGDSLIRIANDAGQNWRDLARWNQLENPNRLEVGQVLRVVPPNAVKAPQAAPVPTAASVPVATASTGATVADKPAAAVSDNPTDAAPVGAAPVAQAGAVAAKPLPAAQASPAQTAAAKTPATADETIDLIWPTEGEIIGTFDNVKNKGIDIAGKLGQPVVAAADGRVLIAGTAVRGMGNLVILMHSNTLITAYAHNQSLLVKEDQVVKRGQKIAEMGSSDADRVKLHFEVRRKGFPVDPLKALPPR